MKLGKVFAVVALLWWANVLFYMTPPIGEWTSAGRVAKEFAFNLSLALSMWFPLSPVTPTWFRSLTTGWLWDIVNDDLLPPKGTHGERPLFKVVNNVDELTEQDLHDAFYEGTKGFLIKGFSKGHLDRFNKIEYLIKNFNNDNYTFLSNPHEIKHYKVVGLSDGLKEMKATGNLYMSFADKLVPNNPELDGAINDLMGSVPQFEGHVQFSAVRQSFLSYGTAFRTATHVAPISDWFLQIAGAKRWRFVMPQYSPYMKAYAGPIYPIYYGGRGFVLDNSTVPYIDITSEAGDLMFFPPHWWHEVHNVENGFGFAVGFRPVKHDFKKMFTTLFLPFLAHHSNYPMRMGLFTAAPYKLWRMYSDKSGGGNAMRKEATTFLFNQTDVKADQFRAHMKKMYRHLETHGSKSEL